MMHRQFLPLRLMCRDVTQPARDRTEPKHKLTLVDALARTGGGARD